MYRLLTIICLLPTLLFSLELGPIQVKSFLNEPFSAVIPVEQLGKVPATELTAELASKAEFKTADLQRSNLLEQLAFHVKTTASGQTYIAVSSKKLIKAPFLTFLVKLNWLQGNYVKSYTVLLDPRPETTVKTSLTSTGHEPLSTKRDYQQTKVLGPIKAGESLLEVARSVRPNKNVTIKQVVIALARNNPKALLRHNLNGLMRGSYLKVPTLAQMQSISARAANNAIAKHNHAWKENKTLTLPSLPKAKLQEVAPTPKAEPQLEAAIADALTKQLHQTQQQVQDLQQTNQQLQTDMETLKQQVAVLIEKKSATETKLKQALIAQQQLTTSLNQAIAKAKQKPLWLQLLMQYWWALLLILLLIIVVVILRARKSKAEAPLVEQTRKRTQPTMLEESVEQDITTSSAEKTNDEGTLEMKIDESVTKPEVEEDEQELMDNEAETFETRGSEFDQIKMYIDFGKMDEAATEIMAAADVLEDNAEQWKTLLQLQAALDNQKLFSQLIAKMPNNLLHNNPEMTQFIEDIRQQFQEDVENEMVAEVKDDADVTEQPESNDTLSLVEDDTEASTDRENIKQDTEELSERNQLDLARAYIEMGDFQAAKDLLLALQSSEDKVIKKDVAKMLKQVKN